jgi:hypothetical protein
VDEAASAMQEVQVVAAGCPRVREYYQYYKINYCCYYYTLVIYLLLLPFLLPLLLLYACCWLSYSTAFHRRSSTG